MPTENLTIFFTTESPLHAGAGSTLSEIDLPIQRETHTQHPIVFASGVKGALRELGESEDGKLPPALEAVFGPEKEQASDHSGLAAFTEARTILFPVASFDSVFVWLTCPMALHRLDRDLTALKNGYDEGAKKAVGLFQGMQLPSPAQGSAVVPKDCPALVNDQLHVDECAPMVRDRSVDIAPLASWFAQYALPKDTSYEYWRHRMQGNFAVISDQDFAYLARYRTHIEQHVKIGREGTVADGPWTEESLPPDTVLVSHVICRRALDKRIDAKLGKHNTARLELRTLQAANPRFQMCGSQSTGKGWVCSRLLG